MKLSEITSKEHFKNMLKDPELEKVKQGLEKLSRLFNAYNWEFKTKLDDRLYWISAIRYSMSDEKVKNNMNPLNHMESIKRMFPNKVVRRDMNKENNNTFVYSVNIYDEKQ